MMHDLIPFPGARISLTAIDGIVNEVEDGKPTGVVTINYGRHSLSFEGSEADVMEIIDAYCESRSAATLPGILGLPIG